MGIKTGKKKLEFASLSSIFYLASAVWFWHLADKFSCEIQHCHHFHTLFLFNENDFGGQRAAEAELLSKFTYGGEISLNIH